MNCPECNNGEIFACVFTCNRHGVSAEGEIGEPIETADVGDDKMPDDFAECDNCGWLFAVDGDYVLDAI